MERSERVRQLVEDLAGRGIRAVAMTFVDNAGIARVKAVPVQRLGHAVAWGIGASPVFDVFCVDDSITSGRLTGGPAGDLRLYPDLDRLTPLAAQPGWAWAPADRRTQEGEAYAGCQRTFARTMVKRARADGLELRAAFEIEWFLGRPDATPACQGPAYGMTRVVELAGYVDDLLAALEAQQVPVDQFHPEYAPGQLELSMAPTDPVTAADRAVLVRQTIRAVSQSYGYQVSFAPVVVAGLVGNGGHLHFSPWLNGRNLLSGGGGRYGLTPPGESVLAALLDRLPALCAIGAPSPASYLRLVPQRWAGPWRCWGRENREAALRLITGAVTGAGSERDWAANAELKCFDPAANPYLLMGAVTAVAAASVNAGLTLPPEVPGDPALLPPADQPARLPESLPEALDALLADDVLAPALGEVLLDAFSAVRRAEQDLFAGVPAHEIAEATRWRY